MEALSLKIFQDSELLTLLLLSLGIGIVIFLIFHFTNFHTKNYGKKDWLAVTLLTCLYALFSLWQLGTTSFPNTTWQPVNANQKIILELADATEFDAIYAIYGEGDNNSNLNDYQLGFENVTIQGSNDLEHWEDIVTLGDKRIYQYEIHNGNWDYHYLLITPANKNQTISELGFKQTGKDQFLPISVYEDQDGIAYPATLLIDEQMKLKLAPTYVDEAYFDEVYHPRNAWEIANQQFMYGTVHPLFGTTIMACSIKLLGMHPLAWRLPGALFGIFMVPLFYAILKRLFHSTF